MATVTLRSATKEDINNISSLILESFSAVAAKHGYACEFDADSAFYVAKHQVLNEHCTSTVAVVEDGTIAGVVLVEKYDGILGVDVLAVSTKYQGLQIGKKLIEFAKSLSDGRVRLVTDSFHNVAVNMYLRAGLRILEPLHVMIGEIIHPEAIPNYPEVQLRKMTPEDIESCDEICRQINGISRKNEMFAKLKESVPHVLVKNNKIIGYSFGITWDGHTCCLEEKYFATFLANWKIINGEAPFRIHSFCFIFLPLFSMLAFIRFCMLLIVMRILHFVDITGLKHFKVYLLLGKGEYKRPSEGALYVPSIEF